MIEVVGSIVTILLIAIGLGYLISNINYVIDEQYLRIRVGAFGFRKIPISDFKGAEILFEKSYSVYRSLSSEGEQRLLEWLPTISLVLVEHQFLELAATYLQRGVELAQKNLGHGHQNVVWLQEFLSQVKTEIAFPRGDRV